MTSEFWIGAFSGATVTMAITLKIIHMQIRNINRELDQEEMDAHE